MTKKRSQHTVDERAVAGLQEEQRHKVSSKDEQEPQAIDKHVENGKPSAKNNGVEEEEGRGGTMKGQNDHI